MGLLSGFKGSLDLTVTNRVYNSGEQIPVEVQIKTKKDLGPGRLFVALVMDEKVRKQVRSSDGGTRTKTVTNELFRHEVDLAIDASFPDNTDQTFHAHLQVPASPQGKNRVTLHDDAPGWVGTLVDVASALNSVNRKTVWHVEARYDIPRLDLKDRQEISVNF